MQRRRRSGRVTVRVMWYSRADRGEAERIARTIEEALAQLGYRSRIRKARRPNRENDGGRIYFTVEVARRCGGVCR